MQFFLNDASEVGTPTQSAHRGFYEQYDTSGIPGKSKNPLPTSNIHGDPFTDFEKLPEVEDDQIRSFPPEEVQPDDYQTYELSGNRLGDPTWNNQGSSGSIGSSMKYQLLNRLAKGGSSDFNGFH